MTKHNPHHKKECIKTRGEYTPPIAELFKLETESAVLQASGDIPDMQWQPEFRFF